MGRKSKQEIEVEEKQWRKLHIHGDAKRSIAAVFLFSVAILLVLGFFQEAGVLGEWLDKIIGLLFGWGKWLFPLFVVIFGSVLLFRKETLFYISKALGLAVAFLSILGFFHLYLEPEKFLKIAQLGEGGGYAGFVVASALLKLTGVTAGSVILSAFFVIGAIIAFNFSLAGFFEKILQWRKKEPGGEGEEVKEEEKNKEGEKENKQEFVKGPDEEKEEVPRKSFLGAFSKKPLESKMESSFEGQYRSTRGGIDWKFPPVELLEMSSGKAQGGDVNKNAEIIQRTLSHFGIEVELGGIQTGPTITQYTFRPAVGIKLSRITGLGNDLALALAAHPIRIEAPIPGKSLIGIEVPNKSVATVRLRELIQSENFKNRKSANLSLALGKNVSGECIFANLGKMPHLMIAGSTGSGKSVCINSVLISLLYQNSPEDLKLILVDPKRVELSLYNGIPHLLSDAIVENSKVLSALKWAIGEMERRYLMLQETGSKDIDSYNQKVSAGVKSRKINAESGEVEEEDIKKLPFIIIVIDELADLMASHGKEVEGAIIRLAQMARAVGIHLIVSTQRPSVEVLTGLIKANITARIAFKVATQIDSRTILDTGGAEKLLGNGDLLYATGNSEGIKRLQGVFVSESEVNKVVKFIKNQKIKRGEEEIGEDITAKSEGQDKIDFGAVGIGGETGDREDVFYDEAKHLVIEAGKASASLLQRRLSVGYARAARLLDILEKNGVIGPGDGAKPREVFVKAGDPEYSDPLQDQEKRDKWQM